MNLYSELMKNNLLYHGEENEEKIVNTIRNVLNRLSPDARETFFRELIGVPVSTSISREKQTKASTAPNTILVGLAGDPAPISLNDLSNQSGGGPVDLYLEDGEQAVAVEAKLGESLNHTQLGRYATALDADEVVTVTWSEVYRMFEILKDVVHIKRQFLIKDSLDYIAGVGLHKNSVTFDRYWGDQDGYKYIRATEDNIIFYTNDHEERGETDRRELSWEQFQELFQDIEERHGADLVEKIFVDVEPLINFFESNTVLGEIDSIRTDDNLLRLFYHKKDNIIKLREVQAKNKSPPAPGSPAGRNETYAWMMNVVDQQEMLESHSREVREQLFIQREWNDLMTE